MVCRGLRTDEPSSVAKCAGTVGGGLVTRSLPKMALLGDFQPRCCVASSGGGCWPGSSLPSRVSCRGRECARGRRRTADHWRGKRVCDRLLRL